MKEFFIILMSFCILSVKAWDFKDNGICYSIVSDEDLTVNVSYYENDAFVDYLEIPENVTKYNKTYKVLGIDDNSFPYSAKIVKIFIPKSIQSLHAGSFRSMYLKDIVVDDNHPNYKSQDGMLLNKAGTLLIRCPRGRNNNQIIPDGVVTLGQGSFEGCKISSLIMPNSVITIEERAFDSCTNLDEIIFSANLDVIEKQAFSRCSFMEIELPSSLRYIGDDAFNGCDHLRSINIPRNVEYLGEDVIAIGFCDGLISISVDADNKKYVVVDNVLYDKEMTILLKCPAKTKIKTITIPNSVKEIARCAFHSAKEIEKIVIPSSVTTIKIGAFWYCYSLNEVVCNAETPPTTPPEESSSEDPWKYSNRKNATLYVPKGCAETYRSASVLDQSWNVHPWSQFKDVIEMETSNVIYPRTSSENESLKTRYNILGWKIRNTNIIIVSGKKYIVSRQTP